MFRFSLAEFPKTGFLKDSLGLPWGCTVQPLSPDLVTSIPFEGSALASEIARCKHCYAYINSLVKFNVESWECSVCYQDNPLDENDDRYFESYKRSMLPEILNPAIDYLVELPPQVPKINDVPIYVMVVDISASDNETFIPRVQSSIIAAIEGMPESALFGLVTFGSRIGIWNLNNITNSTETEVFSHVHYLPIKTRSDIKIDQIIDITDFLVPISTNVSTIMTTIENIHAMPREVGCGFGPTIQLLLDYFSLFESLHVKATVFLVNKPNIGVGMIAEDQIQSFAPVTTFYKDEASRAVEIGVCIDLAYFPLGPDHQHSHFGLSSLHFLTEFTGGNLSVYFPDDKLIDRDFYKRFSSRQAFHGLLRLRTSEDFLVSEAYGHLVKDKVQDDLFHVQACDIWKTFAFDFKYTTSAGLSRSGNRPPALQLAFAYSHINGKNQGKQGVVERYLRIHTIHVSSTYNLGRAYQSADAETVILLLNHKLLKVAIEKGTKEAREFLNDWLLNLFMKSSRFILSEGGKSQKDKPELRATDIDLHFNYIPRLKLVPRFVFAMFKSPLFTTRQVRSSDHWISLYSMTRGLDSTSLATYLYPALIAYDTINNIANERVHLSKAAMLATANHLFILDAYSSLVIYYTENVSPDIPFPPPKDSIMWKYVGEVSEKRFFTPTVKNVKVTNSPTDAQLKLDFELLLLEERTKEGGSFSQFLETCCQEVVNLSR